MLSWLPKRKIVISGYMAFGIVIAMFQGCGQSYDHSMDRNNRFIEAGRYSNELIQIEDVQSAVIVPLHDIPE